MIDTLKLVSPSLSEADAESIEQACTLRQAVEIGTGQVQYSLTTGSLLGSFDHRVSIRVEREAFVPASHGLEPVEPSESPRRGHAIKLPCAPYLIVEGSVHKAILGHNVYGGPLCPVASGRWFVDHVGGLLGVALPAADDWTVQRLDWAEVFDLGSFEGCAEYISGLNSAQFPRRDVVRHGSESLWSTGTTTGVKIYHKGPEFYAHDRKRLRSVFTDSQVVDLQERANRILRFETTIKAKKLTEDFKGKPTVVQVTRDYCERVHDREIARLVKEAAHDMETVRTHQEVSRRLIRYYGTINPDGLIVATPLSNALFGTWMQLSALGEAEVRRRMTRRTFYRQKKQLIDSGVSWEAADVYIDPRHSAIPKGFSPNRLDPRRLTDESEEVRSALQLVG